METTNTETAVALVAGATRPIGKAVAHLFGKQGMQLVLPVFDDWPESTAAMTREFQSAGYDFLCHPCDCRDPIQVQALATAVESRYKDLDYLVNNLERGGMPIVHGSYHRPVNLQQWELEFDTTLKAKRLLFENFLPLLRSGRGGAAVNLSSVAALVGRSGPAAPLFSDGYSAANRGLGVLTETWARQAAPEVRVNEVMLGLIQGRHAQQTRGWSLLSERQRRDLTDQVLLQRTGLPEEVAAAVYFLAVEASYITGATLRVDGGYCLGGEQVPPLPPGVI